MLRNRTMKPRGSFEGVAAPGESGCFTNTTKCKTPSSVARERGHNVTTREEEEEEEEAEEVDGMFGSAAKRERRVLYTSLGSSLII